MMQQKQLHSQNNFCQPGGHILWLSFTLGKDPNLDMLRSVGSILEKHDDKSIHSLFLDGFLQNVNQDLKIWLQALKTKHSKNFSLELYFRAIPDALFDLHNISELRLHQCVIDAPDTVQFPSLNKLSLKYCMFREKAGMICNALFRGVQIVKKFFFINHTCIKVKDTEQRPVQIQI